MRKIYTLCLLFLLHDSVAQSPTQINLQKGLTGKVTGLNVQTVNNSAEGARMTLRCGRTHFPNETPMLFVDGVVQKLSDLREINPNSIKSVEILKSAAAVALFGPEGAYGAIYVTTKNGNFRIFVIKDSLDGRMIAGATVSFISADKKDTLMYVANDSGVVVTDKLKPLVQYEMNVSAVGYESVCDLITNIKNEQQIILRRELRTCTEVILTSIGLVRRCGLYCICHTRVIRPDSIGTKYSSDPLIKLFPNPVQKGGIINIEIQNSKEDRVIVKIWALDGRLMLNKSVQGLKGASYFQLATDTRWAAGVYIIQLAYANGKILASDKVIIQ